MDIELRRNDEQSRYEILDGAELVGVADFHVAGDCIVLPHTETASSRRGEGLAERLVRFALDDVRAAGRRAVPNCWYVAEFIETHPEYRDLVATP